MSQKTNSRNEKEVAGSSYILEFYQSIQNIIHEHANYVNTMVYLKNKYKGVIDSGMEEQDDKHLKERTQILRHGQIKSYLLLNSLKKTLKISDEEIKKLDSLYKKIKEEFVINLEDSEKFVIKMNEHLLSDVLNNLVKNSQDFLNNMYDESKK